MRSQQLPNERRHAAARVPRVPSRNVWPVLAATCLAMPHQAAAAAGGASAVETLSRQSFASAAVLVTVFLILFSIGFEKAEHFMLHRPSKVTRPVVRSMFQELTGLGFLGVVLFVVESTPLVTSLSKELFGSTHGSDLASVIHQVHMVGCYRCWRGRTAPPPHPAASRSAGSVLGAVHLLGERVAAHGHGHACAENLGRA